MSRPDTNIPCRSWHQVSII